MRTENDPGFSVNGHHGKTPEKYGSGSRTSLFDREEVLCRQGYYADAIDLLEKVQAAEPGRARASQLKGYALDQWNSFEEARNIFTGRSELIPIFLTPLFIKVLSIPILVSIPLRLTSTTAPLRYTRLLVSWYAKGLTLAIQEKYDASILAYEQVLNSIHGTWMR